MSEPKIPPEIARKIAQMAKPAPQPAPKAASPRAAAPAPRPTPPPARPAPGPGRWPVRLAAVGWLTALLAIAVATGEYYWFAADKKSALAAQAAEYEARLAALKAEADATLQKTIADAEASQQILKTELDFEKQPSLPLKLAFRPGGVLYVENEDARPFTCQVRLTRALPAQSKEYPLTINARAFRDLGAIDDWVFARGDRIEILKPGYKPWSGTFP